MIELAIAGSLGGLAKSLAEQNGRIALPGLEKSDGSVYLHLGFIGTITLGAIVAYYMATNPLTAFTSGIAATFIVEKFFEKTVLKTPKPDGV